MIVAQSVNTTSHVAGFNPLGLVRGAGYIALKPVKMA